MLVGTEPVQATRMNELLVLQGFDKSWHMEIGCCNVGYQKKNIGTVIIL